MHEMSEESAPDAHELTDTNAISTLLSALCDITDIGFAVVAGISDIDRITCAVIDKINIGQEIIHQLPLDSAASKESRKLRELVVINRASIDPIYHNHYTIKAYEIESYIAVPIVLLDGHVVGHLCAMDRAPAKLATPTTVSTFEKFAALIELQLTSMEIVERSHTALERERSNNQYRAAYIHDCGGSLLSSIRAIHDSSGNIDRDLTTPATVRRHAIRIRTAALEMSSLTNRLLDVSRQTIVPQVSGLMLSNREASPTDECCSANDEYDRDLSNRQALESLLLQRVGEPNFHIGRYDMHALSIAQWMARKSGISATEGLTVRTRGAWILSVLHLRYVPQDTIAEFSEINEQLLSVVKRQDISAENLASIPWLQEARERSIPSTGKARDWFDYDGASDSDLLISTDGFERDICAVAGLYIRLAAWARKISALPCFF